MKSFALAIMLFLSLVNFAQQPAKPELESQPAIPGGKPELKRFFRDHLVYPSEALAKKEEGTVQISFTVTKEGKVIKPWIATVVTPVIDKEALRLFKMMEWIPAKQFGKPVDATHTLDINFSISKYKKFVKERGFEKQAFTDLPADTSFAVHESADKAPHNADPEKTFTEFVYASLEYPEMARKQNIEGKVVTSFIVEPDGRVSNILVKNEVGGGCSEEAIRVIAASKWQPAIKNNMYVRYRIYHTIVFSLKNSFKDNSAGSQRSWGQ